MDNEQSTNGEGRRRKGARQSKTQLTKQQWEEVARRVADGESFADLAQYYGFPYRWHFAVAAHLRGIEIPKKLPVHLAKMDIIVQRKRLGFTNQQIGDGLGIGVAAVSRALRVYRKGAGHAANDLRPTRDRPERES